MKVEAMNGVTQILSQIEDGDPSAAEQLLPLVYEELKKLAAAKLANEKPGQTLQATALVHEAYLRLLDGDKSEDWKSRGHFFGAAAEAMRRILVEQARSKKSLKRGGGMQRVDLTVNHPGTEDEVLDLLALDEVLKKLESVRPRQAEIVKLRFFAGLTVEQAAVAVGVSPTTADTDWAYARAWLRLEMGADEKTPEKS
jgi:RNA polymerase sigma factor (TIGR02999 family)